MLNLSLCGVEINWQANYHCDIIGDGDNSDTCDIGGNDNAVFRLAWWCGGSGDDDDSDRGGDGVDSNDISDDDDNGNNSNDDDDDDDDDGDRGGDRVNESDLGPVPQNPISVNPGLTF